MASTLRPLMLSLMKRMGEVEVKERFRGRDSDGKAVYGYTFGDGRIEVNPIPSVLDTLIHELLHSLHPEYSEATVRRLTGRVMRAMSDGEMLAFYDAYQKQKVEG